MGAVAGRMAKVDLQVAYAGYGVTAGVSRCGNGSLTMVWVTISIPYTTRM
jgi:hypothetical protein